MLDTRANNSKSTRLETVGKLRLRVHRFGVIRATVSMLLDSINWFVHLRVLRVLELQQAWIDPAAVQPNTPYQCRFLDHEEIRAHAEDPNNPLPNGFLATARAKEDRCFGILDGTTLASFGWYSIRPTQIGKDKLFYFPEDYAYMFHGYTRPEYRGQRLHSLGITRATRAFVEEGCAGVVSLLEPTNWASRASAYGLGFRPVGTIIEVGVRARTRYLVSCEARAHGCYVE